MVDVSAPCPFSADCGGCQIPEQAYAQQLLDKQEYTANLLRSFSPRQLNQIIPSPATEYFRNRMDFSCFTREGRIAFGMHRKAESFGFVEVDACRVFRKDTGEVFSCVREWMQEHELTAYDLKRKSGFLRHAALRQSFSRDELLMTLSVCADIRAVKEARTLFAELYQRLRQRQVPLASLYVCANQSASDTVLTRELVLMHGEAALFESINGVSYAVLPNTFLQANSGCCALLYRAIAKELQGISGAVLDMHCGSGGIALQLAAAGIKVTGVDNSPENIEAARTNAAGNRLTDVDFICRDADEFFSGCGREEGYSGLVVDPPRAGLSRVFKKLLLGSGMRTVVYVSCDPMQLRGDLQDLQKGYRLESATAVDMFPHTRHLEIVCRLIRI